MNLDPNTVDGVLLLILLTVAFLALLKGFVKEFFSISNLIIATIISYKFAPLIADFIHYDKVPAVIIGLVVRFVIFVLMLIIGFIVFSKISKPLLEKIPAAVDRSLGFGLGFIKCYSIFCLIFAVIISFYPNLPQKDPNSELLDKPPETNITLENLQPEIKMKAEKPGPNWLKNSRSYSFLQFGAQFFQPLVNGMVSNLGVKDMLRVKNQDGYNDNQKMINQHNKKDSNAQPSVDVNQKNDGKKNSSPNKPEPETGYTKEQINKMKRLIEIMDN